MVIEKLIELAKEKGGGKVMLMSSVHRTAAHEFYADLGFTSDSKKSFDMRLQ